MTDEPADIVEPVEGPDAVAPIEAVWPVDVEQLAKQLAEARDSEQKQLLWWLVGTTPAALLPVLVAVSYDQNLLASVFIATALVIQTVRWFSSRKNVRRIEEEYAAALEAQDDANPMLEAQDDANPMLAAPGDTED